MPAARTPAVLCIGEALIDVIEADGGTTEHVGGSPLNVACGLAALGHPTRLASWWAVDGRGALIEKHLGEHGVGVVPGSDAASSTSVARARFDAMGNARYDFKLSWQVPSLPDPVEFGHLHVGSLGSTLEPGGTEVLAAAQRMAASGRTVSYDPNVRPTLMGDPVQVRHRVEAIITVSDVVKASDEDIAWLYGEGVTIEEVLGNWLGLGAGLVVATRGASGACARLAGSPMLHELDAAATMTGDSVGAGDSFMAGLLSGLLDAGLLGTPGSGSRLGASEWQAVAPALSRAALAAGATVGHYGAFSPHRAELVQAAT